jgi:hypothetical protein
MPIAGITIVSGATTLLTSEDSEAFASDEPVFLPARMIDTAINNGTLQAGAFNRVTVYPPVEAWPPEWKFLKE